MNNDHASIPMSIARIDFISKLAELINTSTLPPFVISDILKDAYNKMEILSKKQLENDVRLYRSALSSAKQGAE